MGVSIALIGNRRAIQLPSEEESSHATAQLGVKGVRISKYIAFTRDGSSGRSPRSIYFPNFSRTQIDSMIPMLTKLRPIEGTKKDFIFLRQEFFDDLEFRTNFEDSLPRFHIFSESSELFDIHRNYD